MQELEERLFHFSVPHYATKRQFCIDNHIKFAHYCHNSSLHAILSSNSFWLRNSNYMNDYSEIQYGKHLILNAYNNNNNIKSSINNILSKTDKHTYLDIILDELVALFLKDCYIASLSEHAIENDNFGRLSMWRAYAPENGISLILNNDVFLDEIEDNMAVTVPVNYVNEADFIVNFGAFVHFFESNLDKIIANQNKGRAFDLFMRCLVNIITTSKHPSFDEEKEWRLLYLPSIFNQSKFIDKNLENVGGITQIIHSINLTSLRVDYGMRFSFDKMIYKILIGPTVYPLALNDAIVESLTRSSVTDPQHRVSVTFIPLRT